MICLHSISISPHLMSFFEPLTRLCKGATSYHYVVTEHDKERIKYGWSDVTTVRTVLANADKAREERLEAEILIDAMRELDVLERRQREGRISFYMSERWFKPPVGIFRLLHPRFFSVAYRMAKLLSGEGAYYLAQGPAAARDMARICGIMHGKIWYLLVSPKISFEQKPGARVNSRDCPNMYLWGYFVSPTGKKMRRRASDVIKVLWVGRMLSWKRTIDLVEAVKKASVKKKIELDIYGEGPENDAIRNAAAGHANIHIHGFVRAEEVRALMKSHNVYVLPSNAYEGWGATLSEALEEGMCVYGTYEAGAASAMLPDDHLFHCGDVNALARLLCRPIKYGSIGVWSGEHAAKQFKDLCNVLSR